MRLGKHQLGLLSGMSGVFSALVVPSPLSRSLVKRGLMVSGSTKTDGFLIITPAGYRAIADALEAGSIKRGPVEEWAAKRKGGPA